jgi:hypothetical protein
MYQWLKASRISPRHNEHQFIKSRLAIPTLASRMPSLYTPGQAICCCIACNADRGSLCPTSPPFTELNAIWSKANGMLASIFWKVCKQPAQGTEELKDYESGLSVECSRTEVCVRPAQVYSFVIPPVRTLALQKSRGRRV